MSQPALTVRIRHLEEALGVRLLDRTTRSVALTQIGRGFLPVVARVLGEIDAVAVNARDVADGDAASSPSPPCRPRRRRCCPRSSRPSKPATAASSCGCVTVSRSA